MPAAMLAKNESPVAQPVPAELAEDKLRERARRRVERWSDGDRPGDWDPWILWIAGQWFLWVASVVLRAYFEGDKEAENGREFARLKQG